MSQLCAVTKCTRTTRGFCDCCQKNLCIQHLSEHNASLISQLNPLTDEINALGGRLKSLNIQSIIGDYCRELEAWRNDCYQRIDHIFKQKCQELDQLINRKVTKQQVELVQLQSRVATLVREQEATRQDIDSLAAIIRHLKEKMDQIEHTSVDIHTRPLMIDDHYLQVEEVNKPDLTALSSVCKTINRPVGSKMIISSNGRFLLMHRKPNLCFLDTEFKIVKEVLWDYGHIYDTCWSSTLNQFILVGEKLIFHVDDQTMVIDHVLTIEERKWLSCTCSETALFLSTNERGSSIMKFTLQPSIELAEEWKSSHICTRDEFINDVIYNDGTLGVLIDNQSEKSLRLELRSVETLDCIWSLPLDIVCNQTQAFRCCLLAYHQWLIIDYKSNRLLHVRKDGKLKAMIPYDATPYRANVFGNMFVVSTQGGVNFHEL